MGQIGAEQIEDLKFFNRYLSRVEIQLRNCVCTNATKNTWDPTIRGHLKHVTKHSTCPFFPWSDLLSLLIALWTWMCACMNDLACICAGSKHKRPSVQSDKVPISQSCDSDFLSVCQTATEGLSIQARAHILSHLLKYKRTQAAQTWKIAFFYCPFLQ